MALAYPYMQSSVAQLFYRQPGAPRVALMRPGEDILPEGEMGFAEMQATVASIYPDDVLAGVLTEHAHMLLAPKMEFRRKFVSGDQLVLFTRRPDNKNEEKKTDTQSSSPEENNDDDHEWASQVDDHDRVSQS